LTRDITADFVQTIVTDNKLDQIRVVISRVGIALRVDACINSGD